MTTLPRLGFCLRPKVGFKYFIDCKLQLCFHPSNSSWLLSGSTDGLINIFDTTITDEDEAILQITNHGSSIHQAGFLSPTEFYALSHDEIFSIYHLDTDSGETKDAPPTSFGDLRRRLDCEYVVNILNPGDGRFFLSAGTYRYACLNCRSNLQSRAKLRSLRSSKQSLDLVPLRHTSEWSLDLEPSVRLAGAHGEDIVRSTCFDREVSRFLTTQSLNITS